MVTRLGGLVTGMDTDSMVKEMLKGKRASIDKLKQKQQQLEWKRDDFRDMNTSLGTFSKYLFDTTGKSTTFNKKVMTSSNESVVVAAAKNATANSSYSITVSKLAESAKWEGSAGVASKTATWGTDETLSFDVTNVDGTTKTVSIAAKATDTLEGIATKLSSSSLGVTAFFDSSNKLVISNNQTGTGANLKVTAGGASLTSKLNLSFDGSGNMAFANGGTSVGSDANLTINGSSLTSKSNTVSFNGFDFTLKATSATPVSITSKTDTDSIVNSVKEFVTKYNELIDKVSKKYKEPLNRSYQPLTDEQKKSLSEEQITKWEEKAKQGMLKGDSALQTVLSDMRTALSTPVTGSSIDSRYQTLSSVGISTTSDISLGGMLTVDETKLRKAIEDNPNAVNQLFNAVGTTTSEKGIVDRLRTNISTAISSIERKAGKSYSLASTFEIGRSLTTLSQSVVEGERRYKMNENRYYAQFARLEAIQQKAQAQASYLQSKLG